jgi:MFS family permease
MEVAAPVTFEHSMPSALRRWCVVAALSFASVISYIDRQIINLLVEPIKADLGLSDVQISLLQGFSFALLYAVLAIPLAWLADRGNRKWVILAGMICWSAATFSSGLATGFAMLFVARMTVGIGEVTLAPAGFSILSDCFPPQKLPLAISIFTGSGFIGSGLALVIGGATIAHMNAIGHWTLPFGVFKPWQMTFMAVALMSVPAFLLLLMIREPARHSAGQTPSTDAPPPAFEVFAFLRANAIVFVPLILGLSCFVAAQFGLGAWAPSYFIRVHGWPPEHVGKALGPVVMFAGLGGIVAGGLSVQRLMAAGLRNASLRVSMLAIALAIPFAAAFPFAKNPDISLALLAVVIFLGNIPVGSTVSTFPLITPNRMRAQVLAIYLLVANLLGYSAGPTLIAWITDKVYADPKAIGLSLAIAPPAVMVVGLLLLTLAFAPYRQLLEHQQKLESELPHGLA